MAAYVAVRLKGHRRIRSQTEDAMKSLRLTRANHAVVVPDTPDYKGQLLLAKDYITFGTIEAPEIATLIRSRGRLEGDAPVTDAVVAKGTKYKSIDEFAKAIAAGQAKYSDLAGVTPIFRLHPPRKGLKSLKRHVQEHGDLGDRGAAMKDLLARMI
jgi:large subunit ribosomal protein L30